MGSFLLGKLLAHYGLSKEEYIDRIAAPLGRLSIPGFKNTEDYLRAKSTILRYIKEGKSILCYGDYDVDGVASTSIAIGAIRELGGKARGYLPSRYEDGYGLNEDNVRRIAESGYSLIIALDNGVSCHKAIDLAYSLGLEVVIIDHHEIGESLPHNSGIVHHALLDYGEYGVSAGYTSHIFFRDLLGHDDPYYLSLAALSTLSDQMPLRAYNRDIVRLGLEAINKNKFKEFALLADKDVLGYDDLSYSVIPSLNSIGRLKKKAGMQKLLAYFRKDGANKEKLSTFLKVTNQERKDLSRSALEDISIDPNAPAIVAISKLPEGLNGLIAAQITTSYNKPAAVFARSEGDDERYVGSLRAPSLSELDLFKALSEAKVNMLSFGGHSHAAGVSIRKEELPAFEKEFAFMALKYPKTAQKESVCLNFEDVSTDGLRVYESFAPFGNSWNEPYFELPPLEASELTFAKGGEYLSSRLPNGGRVFSFQLNENNIPSQGHVVFKGSLRRNEFNGRVYCQFLADAMV